MQTTSPFITSIDTPFKTSRLPKDLCTSFRETMGSASVQLMALQQRPVRFRITNRHSLTVNRFSSRIVNFAMG